MPCARHLIVDAFNVIHALPHLKEVLQSLGEAPARERLANEVACLHDPHALRLTLVFDGQGPNVTIEHPTKHDSYTHIFSPAGASADSIIERMARNSRNPSGLTVVSNDHAISEVVRSVGGFIMSADQLADWVARASCHQSKQLGKARSENQKNWKLNNPWDQL